jgi:hypothetical protein
MWLVWFRAYNWRMYSRETQSPPWAHPELWDFPDKSLDNLVLTEICDSMSFTLQKLERSAERNNGNLSRLAQTICTVPFQGWKVDTPLTDDREVALLTARPYTGVHDCFALLGWEYPPGSKILFEDAWRNDVRVIPRIEECYIFFDPRPSRQIEVMHRLSMQNVPPMGNTLGVIENAGLDLLERHQMVQPTKLDLGDFTVYSLQKVNAMLELLNSGDSVS